VWRGVTREGSVTVARALRLNAYRLLENMKGRSYWGDLALDGRMLLKRILNKCVGDVERICLVRVRDQWLAVVNTALNFRLPLKERNFLTCWTTTSFSSSILLEHANLVRQIVARLTS
jgi:hypothetical protein